MLAPTGQLGQVHMVKKIFPIFLHAGSWSFLLMNLWFSSKLVSKMNFKKMAPAWRNFKNIFFTICTWPNRPVGAKILSGFQFEGKTDVWISQVRHVKVKSLINVLIALLTFRCKLHDKYYPRIKLHISLKSLLFT